MAVTTYDYAKDFATVDRLVTVTFTPQQPTGTAVTTAKAFRRALTYQEMSFIGDLGSEKRHVVFELVASTLGGNVPKPADKIAEAGGKTWRLLTADEGAFASSYRAICVEVP